MGLVELLRAVLDKTGEVVIRPMPAEYGGQFLGLSTFADNTLYVADQDDAEWLKTLVHELHHHLLGPCEPRFVAAAEARVRAATDQTLAAMRGSAAVPAAPLVEHAG